MSGKAENYISGLVNALLAAIDNQDWDSLNKLFCEDTVYEVSAYPRFQGRKAVMDYYRNIRPVLSGTHSVDSLTCEGNRGICCGRFVAVKKDGGRIDLRFADEIEFENLKIKQRRVYYCQPAD